MDAECKALHQAEPGVGDILSVDFVGHYRAAFDIAMQYGAPGPHGCGPSVLFSVTAMSAGWQIEDAKVRLARLAGDSRR